MGHRHCHLRGRRSSLPLEAGDDEPPLQLPDVLDQDRKSFYWIEITELIIGIWNSCCLVGCFQKVSVDLKPIYFSSPGGPK